MSTRFHAAILDGHKVKPCSLEEFGKWLKDMGRAKEPPGPRHVGWFKEGDICVSTVFLGMNHQRGDGPPLWFETMIFGGPHDESQRRCSTWKQAEKQHERAVALATRKANDEPD